VDGVIERDGARWLWIVRSIEEKQLNRRSIFGIEAEIHTIRPACGAEREAFTIHHLKIR
jgi:hypothetical protein